MHRLNHVSSAKHLLAALFAATTSASTKQFLHPIPPLRSIACKHIHSSRRRAMDPLSSAATNGIEDLVHSNKGNHVSGENNNSLVRKILPSELSRSAVKLTCDSSAEGGVCDVYLVGTAHVSVESCKEVQAVIDFLKPQVVFMELCASRRAVLTPQELKVPTIGEMLEMWKKNQNPFGILCSWFLAKVASKLEVRPGDEFRVAYEEAMKYGGKVILGDRPVQITLQRTWAKMPLWHKTKLLYSLIFQAVFLPNPEDLNKAIANISMSSTQHTSDFSGPTDENRNDRRFGKDYQRRKRADAKLKEIDDADILTLIIQDMSKQFPTVVETLVDERDQYMSAKLLQIARQHNSVVAVVGKGHLRGIKKNWKQPVDMKEILSVPYKKKTITVRKILGTIGVTIAGVSIISGLYLSVKK